FTITEEGRNVLNRKLSKIDIRFLKQYADFKRWHEASKDDVTETSIEAGSEIETGKTPEELLDYSYSQLKNELALDILEKVKSSSPSFFEMLVIDLLIKMGYGGSRKEAGQVLGKTGDGGIDGLIKEDKLGLDVIYIQAKRWENVVTIHQVRDFAGSLLAKKA